MSAFDKFTLSIVSSRTDDIEWQRTRIPACTKVIHDTRKLVSKISSLSEMIPHLIFLTVRKLLSDVSTEWSFNFLRKWDD